ncbi:hypothetical protein GG344DRAFT_63759 [Lentinula edodes]|nr:hypothetical protein GG344DRAFT_63759 [Lentinula edodes]
MPMIVTPMSTISTRWPPAIQDSKQSKYKEDAKTDHKGCLRGSSFFGNFVRTAHFQTPLTNPKVPRIKPTYGERPSPPTGIDVRSSGEEELIEGPSERSSTEHEGGKCKESCGETGEELSIPSGEGEIAEDVWLQVATVRRVLPVVHLQYEAFSEEENAFLDCGHCRTCPQISDEVDTTESTEPERSEVSVTELSPYFEVNFP